MNKLCLFPDDIHVHECQVLFYMQFTCFLLTTYMFNNRLPKQTSLLCHSFSFAKAHLRVTGFAYDPAVFHKTEVTSGPGDIPKSSNKQKQWVLDNARLLLLLCSALDLCPSELHICQVIKRFRATTLWRQSEATVEIAMVCLFSPFVSVRLF